MTEFTFDQVKVGDRIKAREVYKNGDTFESEVTVTDMLANHIYSAYRVLHRYRDNRESLTIERVQMPEPKKIGTVVEYMHEGDLTTAVRFGQRGDAMFPWIHPSGHTHSWYEILAYDPNPKIKED